MVNRKIKFKISIKEFSVEFEGDIQTAERIQEQVTGAINNLATAPNRLIGSGSGPQPSTGSVVELPSSRRRRRRRGKVSDDAVVLDAEVLDVQEGDAISSRKSTRREGPTSLISSLRSEKFFAQRRTVGQIRAELSKKGYSSYTTSELTPVLARLTQEGLLRREKNSDKQWAYFID